MANCSSSLKPKIPYKEFQGLKLCINLLNDRLLARQKQGRTQKNRKIGPLGVAKQLMSGLGLIPMIEICDDGIYAGCTSREMDR